MTTSIGTFWGVSPAPAVSPVDIPAGNAPDGCDAGTSFKAIAERLAKAGEPPEEGPEPDDATLAQAVVPVLPIAPPPLEWSVPVPLPLPLVQSPDAGSTAPALPLLEPTPPPLLPEQIAIARAAQQAPPLDLGPAAAIDTEINPVERPIGAQPRAEPPPLPARLPEPIPAPVLNPEIVPERTAMPAPVPPHLPEPQPGALSVSGMRAAQEALVRPVAVAAAAAGPHSAPAPEPAGPAPARVDATPEIAAATMPAATSSTSSAAPREPGTNTALGVAARRTAIGVAPSNDLGAGAARRSPAAAFTASDTRHSSGDPLEPLAAISNHSSANSSQSEARFALAMANTSGPAEMQFQPEARVHTAQAPEMNAAQERVAAEMAALVRIGGGEARLDLEPPDLGKLRLRLAVRNRVVEGSITVENPAVKAALEANMQGLVVALERSGFNLERMDIRLADSRRGHDRRENKRDSDAAPKKEPGAGDAPATARASGRPGAGSGLVDYWF